MALDGLIVAAPPKLLLNKAGLESLVSVNITLVVVPLLRIARNVTLVVLKESVPGWMTGCPLSAITQLEPFST